MSNEHNYSNGKLKIIVAAAFDQISSDRPDSGRAALQGLFAGEIFSGGNCLQCNKGIQRDYLFMKRIIFSIAEE